MGTEEPFGRVTKELVMESIEIKECNEQKRWWITPVSSIQEFDEKEKVGNEKVEKMSRPKTHFKGVTVISHFKPEGLQCNLTQTIIL